MDAQPQPLAVCACEGSGGLLCGLGGRPGPACQRAVGAMTNTSQPAPLTPLPLLKQLRKMRCGKSGGSQTVRVWGRASGGEVGRRAAVERGEDEGLAEQRLDLRRGPLRGGQLLEKAHEVLPLGGQQRRGEVLQEGRADEHVEVLEPYGVRGGEGISRG